MKLFKNKATGRHFIYVDNYGENHVVLVTPRNNVIPLERSKFEESEEDDTRYFLSHGFVTEMQTKTYRDEMSRRNSEREIAKQQAAWDVSDKMTDKQKTEMILTAIQKLPAPKRQKVEENLVSWVMQNETS